MATSERSPPKKKTKRLKKYRSKWENDYYWLKCVSDNVYKANCTVCRRVFSIGHGGVGDIKQHGSGENHRKCERLSRTKERPLTTNREHIGGPSTSASETGMLSKSVGSQTLLSGEMSDSLRGAFMAQLTSTMNTLLKTAVCEIAKIFENSLCDHQMELLLKGQESQLENPVLTLEEQSVDEQERDEMKIYDAASLTSESAPCVLNSPEINFEGPIDWCAPLSSDDTAESSQTRPDIIEYPGVPQRSLSVSLWRIPTIKKEVEADFETHLRKALDNCLGEGSSPAKLNDSLECSQDLSSPLPATKRRGPGRPRKSVTQLVQTIRREEPVLQVRRDDKQELSLTEHGNNLSENHDNNKTLPVTEFNSVQDDKAKKHMNDTCKRNTCKFCHKVFNTEFGLKVHVRSHKKCPGCHKTFPFPSTLRVHMKSCSEIKKARTLLKTKSIDLQKQKHKFGTKHCRMEFPNKIAYQNHVFHTHKDRPNLCQLCGKGFYSIRHLSNHYEHVHV
ncbi:zinc finger and BTB domain-containing protein 17-like [Lampris incognitus]|uniref:zinc finger and BTB domain-containing protein 17-like n=1 Tax=Lampris incognitus TaxID=2546036 RepID=UPI0024B5264B|nr:zinc finger and BTB domain-containing protein 17-like [Lampris incognitus]